MIIEPEEKIEIIDDMISDVDIEQRIDQEIDKNLELADDVDENKTEKQNSVHDHE